MFLSRLYLVRILFERIGHNSGEEEMSNYRDMDVGIVIGAGYFVLIQLVFPLMAGILFGKIIMWLCRGFQ